ncbi:MAG: CAAX prenyl protease-related protein [Acidobacteriota bacterium]|nr:CAAX prenyl protease-related protein [Acidobacteriota bacterium]
MGTQPATWPEEYPSVRYVAPFAAFLLLLAIGSRYSFDSTWGAPLRVAVLGLVCILCWPREIPLRPSHPVAGIAIGAAVFFLWIAPDLLIPGYRHSLLFSNSIVGQVHSSLQPAALHSPWILAWRTIRAVVIVPVIEELFWRAWLMRWLLKSDFRTVPLGTYSPFAFWITAILFASEHGPYWDVGLITGVIYNWWMIRSKSVADCILMHAVTNGVLSVYVIATAQWQYWQ